MLVIKSIKPITLNADIPPTTSPTASLGDAFMIGILL